MLKKILITTKLGLLAAAIGVLAFVLPTQSASAIAAGQALEIAPPVVNLSANPGQTITTQVSLRDISSSKLVVSNEINDFVASGEDGTPKILLDETEPNPYSMKTWIAPLAQFTLAPKQIQKINVVINVPANASPGGYYSVIRFTGTPPELNGTGVSLSASLGSLILLRVNGDAKEQLGIQEFSANNGGKSSTLFESTPLNFVERIKNSGNIHEQPAGQVVITDMFGKTVAAVNVNLPPRNILPNSIRKFEQPLDSSVLGNKQLFGKYTAKLNLSYGANKQTVTSEITFWVIPYKLIGGAILLLVIGFFGLRALIKRYNRHIISKAKARR